MTPPFWMHCNVCAVQYNPDKKFYVMSCQHTLCRECMKLTDNGTKCPLDKTDIKYEEVKNLQEKQRSYFQATTFSVLKEPMKIMNFQQKQQKHYMNLIKSYKKKFQKASLIKANLRNEVFQLDADYRKIVAHRKLMQEKLKQIYRKRTQNNNCRDPCHINDINSSWFNFSNTIRSTSNSSSVGWNVNK